MAPFGASVGVAGQQRWRGRLPPLGAQICGGCRRPGGRAPAIHMLMTNIETEVTPAIGGETASEDIINFLLQGFDGDVNRIWQSNIFGKSLYDIAEEGLTSKIESLPENAKQKLQQTLQRIINEGSGGLICILL